MAETKGKDSAPTDPKAQTTSGPVKPPVLEGTARASSASKPTPSSASAPPKPEPAKPAPGNKPAESSNRSSPTWLAGIVGGALGLGAAYGLAWFGLWPTTPQAPQPADPRLAQFATTIPELQTVTNTLQSELSATNSRISGLQSTVADLPTAPTPGTDSALGDEVAALAARIESLSTAPATDDNSQTSEALAALQQQLAQVQQEADDAAARLAAAESQLAALSEATSANQVAGNQTAQLPLIFSGLETAFASGRPYEAELAALERSWPDVAIPNAISAHASTGLPEGDAVARQLNTAIPDILAGRPIQANVSWQDGAMDWMRGIVALRPADAVEGDGPEAQVARLEAAIARRDFVGAASTLSALPAPMLAATGAFAEDIKTLADAQTFLAGLRQSALSAGGQE